MATPAQRRKYADYTVEFRESKHPVSVIPALDGSTMRCLYKVARIPSSKKFVIYIRTTVTAAEREYIHRIAPLLPLGDWARFGLTWPRERRTDGVWQYRQFRGTGIDQALFDLELQLMLNVTASTEVTV